MYKSNSVKAVTMILSFWFFFFFQSLTHVCLCVFCFQVKQDFFELLSDQHIEAGQRWSKVKERLETDPRYKAVESSALREELFKQYMEKQAKVGTGLRRRDEKVRYVSSTEVWFVLNWIITII